MELSVLRHASVNVATKALNPKEMGIRDRLQITLHNGDQEKFLVRELEHVVNEMQAVIQYRE
jgi:hypothetical protein